jgi:creatinine amidohydrolase/Fe(II)-dependent formamide hydrolase-like protein
MHYAAECVDLNTLPARDVPLHYSDFSIVDAPGFTPKYPRDRVVRNDPRDSTSEFGAEIFEQSVDDLVRAVEKLSLS